MTCASVGDAEGGGVMGATVGDDVTGAAEGDAGEDVTRALDGDEVKSLSYPYLH